MMFGYARYKRIYGEKYIIEKAKIEQEFFAILFDEYCDRVYGYFRSRGVNKLDAEDITSAVFMTVVEKIQGFVWEKEGSFEHWLFNIAFYKLCNFIKSEQKEPTYIDDSFFEDICNTKNPNEIFEIGFIYNNIMEAINELSTSYKNIFLLKYKKGLSNKEIASMLEITEKGVSSMLSKTKKQIIDHISKGLLIQK